MGNKKGDKKWITIEQGLEQLAPVIGEKEGSNLLNYCLMEDIIPIELDISVDDGKIGSTNVFLKYREFGEVLLRCILMNTFASEKICFD